MNLMLPNELWIQIIQYASESRCVLFHMLQVNRRMNTCSYASVIALSSYHKDINDVILARLCNLRRACLSNNCGVYTLTNLTYLYIDVNAQSINLSMHHLTELTVASECDIVDLPLSLICLYIHSNSSHINLANCFMLTQLTVMYSPNIVGIEMLTQLQWLQLCADTYMRGDNIAALTQLHTLQLQDSSLEDTYLPPSITSLDLWDCNVINVHNLTALQTLSARGFSRVNGVTTCIKNISVSNVINITTPAFQLFTNLHQLTVNHGITAPYFEDMRILTQLRRLNNIGGTDLPSLAALMNICDLTIGNAGDKCLESLQMLPLLTDLTLGYACIMTNTQLRTLTTLTRLNIYDSVKTITSDGISHLINLIDLILPTDESMSNFTSLTRLQYLAITISLKSPRLIQLPMSIETFEVDSELIKLAYDPSTRSMIVAPHARILA